MKRTTGRYTAALRLLRLLKYLGGTERPTVKQLSSRLDVSERTIKRDLAVLKQVGAA